MARGKIWFVRGTVHAAVLDRSGQVVWNDNTGAKGWRKVLADCRAMTAAFSRVERVGQSFKPWSQVVDEAEI